MNEGINEKPQGRGTAVTYGLIFLFCLGFHAWGVSVGWKSLNLPGQEFRQAQTALSAYFIDESGEFALDYPTPVLGKPWSIPLEFPLYQWAAVGVHRTTDLSLTASGRVVSIASFYLMLPALFLLLRRFDVPPGRRWLVLALVLTSPIYIFYTRAFLIETTALMLSLWFWVSYERGVSARSWAWLILANIAGVGAGLTKVTTFMIYLLPPFLWAVTRLWRARHESKWLGELPWMLAGVLMPLFAAIGWERYSDITRLQNPLAHFLGSKSLRPFTLGTWESRVSPDLWGQKWDTIVLALTSGPVLAMCGVIALFVLRRRWRGILCCGLFFGVPLFVFPILYGRHDYYFIANGVFLLIAMGLVLVSLAETRKWAWLAVAGGVLFTGGQAFQYYKYYYPTQHPISLGGDDLSRALNGLTQPDEVIVVIGKDWNPMFPYYAKRRMMMIREEDERREDRLSAAFTALEGEKLGALAIEGSLENRETILKRAFERGIGAQAIFKCQGMIVFLRDDRHDESIRMLSERKFGGLTWMPGAEPDTGKLAGQWYEVAALTPYQMGWFLGMTPKPVRFFNSYGPSIELGDGKRDYGAHPITRLVFAMDSGEHVLRTTVSLAPETYQPADPKEDPTDGVEMTFSILGKDGERTTIYSRLLNPTEEPQDRGKVSLVIPFNLEEESEVELFFGPGTAGNFVRDWLVMGELVIE